MSGVRRPGPRSTKVARRRLLTVTPGSALRKPNPPSAQRQYVEHLERDLRWRLERPSDEFPHP